MDIAEFFKFIYLFIFKTLAFPALHCRSVHSDWSDFLFYFSITAAPTVVQLAREEKKGRETRRKARREMSCEETRGKNRSNEKRNKEKMKRNLSLVGLNRVDCVACSCQFSLSEL